MAERIGEESIFLRINELKSGKLQFTDATNAARLIKEHGRDIRYNCISVKLVLYPILISSIVLLYWIFLFY